MTTPIIGGGVDGYLNSQIADIEARIDYVGHKAYSCDDMNSPRAHRLWDHLEKLKAIRLSLIARRDAP